MGSTRFMNINTFMNDQDDSENSAENSADSPRYALLNDTKMTSSTSNSPKKSRRSAQKRVISVPIKDVEGSRLKGEMGAPPSDSWAWRKYGQKPIKGSPYPRGYYRCSSSKGCPARKQVERSRIDPTMLMVTYTCEHNHPWPPSRNTNNHHNAAAIASTKKYPTSQTEPTNSGELQEQEDHQEEQKKPTINITTTTTSQTDINMDHDQKLAATLSEYAGCNNNCWFSDFESMLESPPLMMNDEARVTDADMAMFFTMRDEDESFFADLGELPECSTVFRRGMMEREEEECRRHNLAPWCGTTG